MSASAPVENGWKSEMGYIWSILGSAVGFANILSFSAQCYRNGGGAFLIPLLVAYLVLGIPMLVLEALIGQRSQLPLVSAYDREAGKVGKIMGWLSTLSCLTIGGFYAVLTSYAMCYSFYALTDQIPADTASFFKSSFLQDSGSIANWGELSWPVLLGTSSVFLFAIFVLCRQIQNGIEKVCSIFMPLLTILIALFALITSFIPGAFYGISHFLTPDFARLQDPALWRDVFGHLFFSQSLGLGIITGYSRYAKEKINIRRAMIWVAAGDFMISLMAGWVIFASIGAMSTLKNIPFASLVQTESLFDLGFIIFPQVIALAGPLKPFLGALFFFCVFIAGITGVFSITEAAVGNFESEFKMKRKTGVFLAVAISFTLSLFFTMGNGLYILDALTPMVLGLNMLIAALFELVIFVLLSKTMREALTEELNFRSPKLTALFAVCTILFIASIFIGVAQKEMALTSSLPQLIRWGWLIGALFFSILLAFKRKPLIGS